MDTDWGMNANNASRMMGMWFDFMSKMTEAAMSFSPQQTAPEAFRQIRSAQLGAWGDYLQQMMRTPEFLGMMKQGMAMNIQFRKQISDFLAEVQHEFQGVSRKDVDQLMLSMRHLEQRIVEGVEQVSDQLTEVEQRLATLEKSFRGRNGEASDEEERRERRRRRMRKTKPSAPESDQ